MRVAIIGARWTDVEVERAVLGLAEEEVARDPGAHRQAIVAAAADADVILSGSQPQFDAATLAQLPACRGIIRYGIGYDNIDVAAAREQGMVVANVPDYGTEAVAIHAAGLALAALRKIPRADRSIKAGIWNLQDMRPLHLPSALTAGVIGFGRIGRLTAAHFVNLGFRRVLAHDDFVAIDAPGVEAASLTDLLAESDVVSLHIPGATDAGPLIGSDEIAMMRSGSILVNTARGSLIDTPALLAGMREQRPAVAALDVFDPEPADLDACADVLDQLIMTPHMAWYTEETERELRVKAAEEAGRVLAGRPVIHPVAGSGDTA